MKIAASRLKRIIQEELHRAIKEVQDQYLEEDSDFDSVTPPVQVPSITNSADSSSMQAEAKRSRLKRFVSEEISRMMFEKDDKLTDADYELMKKGGDAEKIDKAKERADKDLKGKKTEYTFSDEEGSAIVVDKPNKGQKKGKKLANKGQKKEKKLANKSQKRKKDWKDNTILPLIGSPDGKSKDAGNKFKKAFADANSKTAKQIAKEKNDEKPPSQRKGAKPKKGLANPSKQH